MVLGMNSPTSITEIGLPQAHEIERIVLGAMLVDPESIPTALKILDETCFYSSIHKQIFNAIVYLSEQGKGVDFLTTGDELKKQGVLKSADEEVYISELASIVGSVANLENHCNILMEKALLRELLTMNRQYEKEILSESAEAEEILQSIQTNVLKISEKRSLQDFSSIGPIVHKAYDEIFKIVETGSGITGVDTGFRFLNNITAGFQKSDLVILAGRPSMGKTALGLDIARNAANKGVGVGIFSLEMTDSQLVQRMLFNEARLDRNRLRRDAEIGSAESQDFWTRLSDSSDRLSKLPIFIDDSSSLTVAQIGAKARRLKIEHNIGLIVVDYLQLIQPDRRAENRQQEISLMSRSLKALAKDLDLPVLTLSQLSRASEIRPRHRPQLSDLRESGAIEQDADLVMFIYRAIVYNDEVNYDFIEGEWETANIAEIIIGKQRNGPTGTVFLCWTKEYTRFENLDYHPSEGDFS